MNIVCCIKQVPATDSVRFDREKGTLIREGVTSEINPYDLFALEAGVDLKEQCGGELTVLTMGPPQAEEALREAISRGADNGVLLSDRAFAGSDTLATSYILAKAIEKLGTWDLVLCGKQTTDGDTAQVGPGLAQRLGVPCATCVESIELIEERKVRINRRLEEGTYTLVSQLPMVMAVEVGANSPRMPSLRGKMRAKKAEIPCLTAESIGVDQAKIGLNGSPTRVSSTYVPEFSGKHELLQGTPKEQVDALIGILRETGIL